MRNVQSRTSEAPTQFKLRLISAGRRRIGASVVLVPGTNINSARFLIPPREHGVQNTLPVVLLTL